MSRNVPVALLEKIVAATAIELVVAVIGLGLWLACYPGRATVGDRNLGSRVVSRTRSSG